jgi:hypothetical protein
MKQIELTSILVLAIIGLSSVGAILVVPTVYATSATTPISNNNTTSTSSDDNGDGRQIPSQEDLRNLFGGAINDALQLKVMTISSPSRDISPNNGATFDVNCPQGMFATGAGFFSGAETLDVTIFQPAHSNGDPIQSGDTPDAWHAGIFNPTTATINANVWVVWVGLGQ